MYLLLQTFEGMKKKSYPLFLEMIHINEAWAFYWWIFFTQLSEVPSFLLWVSKKEIKTKLPFTNG